MTECYHCGEVVQAEQQAIREIAGQNRTMCCEGCATVAAVIHASGLSAYYRKRTALPRPVDETKQSLPEAFADILDDEMIRSQFVRSDHEELNEADFIVQNMHCPSCVWLIENRLSAVAGIDSASVNYRTQKLSLKWRRAELSLADIARTIESVGYQVVPYSHSEFSRTIQARHQDLLKRTGIAGIFGMQIMVIAVALYASAWTSIEIAYEELFRRLSLLFVLPIMFYCAAPIFRGALQDLKQRSATMDVPIALGLMVAFIASLFATLSGTGEIYYDSIAMFVFFQLTARFLEQGAYRKMNERINSLTAAAPTHANRLTDPDNPEHVDVVPALRLKAGERVLVRPGEAFPADGHIVKGSTDINEAILTGESNVITQGTGGPVFGGSINVSQPVVVKVSKPSSASALAAIVELLEKSVSQKPSGTRLTDRIAGKFSATVVLIAVLTGAFWYYFDSPGWLAHSIAVLVVACPCALALAVPTALTATVNAAAREGILIARPDAVHELARADTFVFDKTGTLTQSDAQLKHVETFSNKDRPHALGIAAALASASEHPASKALVRSLKRAKFDATDILATHGSGIAGVVNGKKHFLGSLEFIRANTVHALQDSVLEEQSGLVAYLSDEQRVIAVFYFDNPLREDAVPLIGWLKTLPVKLALVTGDRKAEAHRVAARLDIAQTHWGCSPEDKLGIIKLRQSEGEYVAMVGDGVNDAPVLAAANVSVAPANSQQIAKAHADVLLLDDQLKLLAVVRSMAEFAVNIMRNNTIWAIAYNLVGISLAAAGLVPPLAAAVGMSVSSLAVVGNSLRIMSFKPTPI